MQFLVVALAFISCVLANTEVHLIKVPNYYNIPVSSENSRDPSVLRINDTSLLLLHHPIVSLDAPDTSECKIEIPFDFQSKHPQRLFVKINNYNNVSYGANDLLHVKFCWPATTPLSYRLDHVFLKNNDLYENELQTSALSNQLEIYLVVDVMADFHAVREVHEKTFKGILQITRLPNALPIPLELYDFILYALDLMIVAVVALPHLQSAFYRLT